MRANGSLCSETEWAICSWFTLSLSKNEWFAKKNVLFTPRFWQFFTAFPHFMPKSELLPLLCAPSLFFKERQEQIAPVTIYERATVSESLVSLFTIEWPWANRYFALSLTINERFDQKPKERISNPGNDSPPMQYVVWVEFWFKAFACCLQNLPTLLIRYGLNCRKKLMNLHIQIKPVTARYSQDAMEQFMYM